MKYSKQRQTILEIIQNRCDHPTAQTIYEQVKTIIPNISLGTVYRNLNSLYENGLINRVQIPNHKDRFDYNINDHAHVYCLNCNEIFDLSKKLLKDIDKIIEDNLEFTILSNNLVFLGICNECRRKEE